MKHIPQKPKLISNLSRKISLTEALCTILILLFSGAAASARSHPPIEIWVTPNGTGGGSGTQDDPFSAPDADSFFNLINDLRTIYLTNIVHGTTNYYTNTLVIPEYSTIHLMPGTFEVREGLISNASPRRCITMKQGWKVRGAGMDATVIQLVTNATPVYGNGNATRIHVFDGTAVTGSSGLNIAVTPLVNAEVSDLTVDCNLQNQNSTPCVQAVVMHGTHNKVSRVKAINWGSTSTNAEVFVFSMGPNTSMSASDKEDGLIEDCVATQPAPVTFTGGGVFCAGGDASSGARHQAWEIRGCIVKDVNINSATFYAYGPGNGCEVSDCVAINLGGGGNAVYNDTVVNHDQIYRHNSFLNVGNGIVFNGSDNDVSNIVIMDNIITSTNGWGINLYMPAHSMQGVRIEGNVIRPVFHGASMAGALAVNGIVAPITFSADNNILNAGGRGGWDFFCNGPQYTNLNCLSFVNNRNLRGQPLFYGTDSNGITSALNKFRRP